MFDHLDDANPPQPGPVQRGRVSVRADALQRRRRIVTGLAIAVAVVLVAAIPGVLAASGGGTKKVQTAAGPATTSSTSVEAPGVVTPVTETVPPATTTSTPPATTTTSVKRTTSTTIVCRNSYNPACGPFHWDPPVQDLGATMTITWTPSQPKVGEKVTFRVVIEDPDDPSPHYTYKQWDYGEANGQIQDGDISQDTCENRYGPWTPPQPAPGRYEQEGGYGLEYTFSGAGPHNVYMGYNPGGPNWCYDPYNMGTASGKAVVTVSP